LVDESEGHTMAHWIVHGGPEDLLWTSQWPIWMSITLGEHVCTITRGDGYVHLCMTSPEVMLYAHEVHTWYMTRGHVLHTCDVQGHPMPMDHWS